MATSKQVQARWRDSAAALAGGGTPRHAAERNRVADQQRQVGPVRYAGAVW